jgi:hypothetical protein
VRQQRLTVGGLSHLKAVERDRAIKSAYPASTLKSPGSKLTLRGV